MKSRRHSPCLARTLLRLISISDGTTCEVIHGIGTESVSQMLKPGGRCPPDPLGFSALDLLQQTIAGRSSRGRTARPAVRKAPVGARVASPQSPILRWSKEKKKTEAFLRRVSRVRFPGGV